MAFCGAFSVIFALLNAINSNIISNVKINDIDVSKMDQLAAEENLKTAIEKVLDDEIKLTYEDTYITITPNQMETKTNIQEAVYIACMQGRESNIFKNNFDIIKTKLIGKNIELNINFNEKIAESIYSNIDEEWTGKFVDNSYYIEEDSLIIEKGKTGVVLDKEKLDEEIKEAINKKISGQDISEIEIPTKIVNPEDIDIEKIRNVIYREAQNAYYDEENETMYPHVNGVDLAIGIEDAKNIVEIDKEVYEIPITTTVPEITTEKFGEKAFPIKLASFVTRYDASDINRSTNIELSAKAMNEKVLAPEEVFSFNDVVGPRSASKGYLIAGAYAAGELIQSYGGGVCQVSSTLYNVALYANLEIVQRYNHPAIVSYVEAGRDATVSYGYKDFKFKNTRSYSIKIKTDAKNGILTIEFWGIPETEEFEIELKSDVTDVIKGNTRYVYDSSLKTDEEIVEVQGHDGLKSVAYKVVKKNGLAVSQEILSEDVYNPLKRVVRTGDKGKK